MPANCQGGAWNRLPVRSRWPCLPQGCSRRACAISGTSRPRERLIRPPTSAHEQLRTAPRTHGSLASTSAHRRSPSNRPIRWCRPMPQLAWPPPPHRCRGSPPAHPRDRHAGPQQDVTTVRTQPTPSRAFADNRPRLRRGEAGEQTKSQQVEGWNRGGMCAFCRLSLRPGLGQGRHLDRGFDSWGAPMSRRRGDPPPYFALPSTQMRWSNGGRNAFGVTVALSRLLPWLAAGQVQTELHGLPAVRPVLTGVPRHQSDGVHRPRRRGRRAGTVLRR